MLASSNSKYDFREAYAFRGRRLAGLDCLQKMHLKRAASHDFSD
jgi:hypothetical protein